MKQRNVRQVSYCSLALWALLMALPAQSLQAEAPAASGTQVYQCTKNGERIFSDQPCGNDSQARTIEVTSRMDAIDVRPTTASASQRIHSKKPQSEHNGSLDEARKQCSKIGRDKNTVTAKMRAGYSAAQGERLRERLRSLNDRYFELRCSRFS